MKDPDFKNRIIGNSKMGNDLPSLGRIMGASDSIRADEGTPFEVGPIARMGDRVVFHGLEHTHIRIGQGCKYGRGSLIHGGKTPFGDYTILGDECDIGELSVVFRSRLGEKCVIGSKSLVQDADLPRETVIPDHTVRIGNQTRRVEW